MRLDLALLALVLLFAALGFWRGAISQLAKLGALVAAFFGAQPLGRFAGAFMAVETDTPLLLASLVCTFAAFFLIYLVTAVVLWLVLRELVPGGATGAVNRWIGFALGGAKALALVAVALSAAVYFEKPIVERFPSLRPHARDSRALVFFRQHNVFEDLPELARLRTALREAAARQAAPRPAEAPLGAEASTDKRLQDAMRDARIRKLLADGDMPGLLASPKVRELLSDQNVERLLRGE